MVDRFGVRPDKSLASFNLVIGTPDKIGTKACELPVQAMTVQPFGNFEQNRRSCISLADQEARTGSVNAGRVDFSTLSENITRACG